MAYKAIEPYFSGRQGIDAAEILFLEIVNKNIDITDRADIYLMIKKNLNRELKEQALNSIINSLKSGTLDERAARRVCSMLQSELPKGFTI